MSTDMSPGLVYPPTCRWHLAGGYCGATEVRPFPGGSFCREHAPWARAGTPEPVTPIEMAQRQEQVHAAPEA